jgi:Na+/H+-dicarboxylate symporter
MKIWIKVIIGLVIGSVIALFLPAQDPTVISTVDFLASLVVNLGKFCLVPLFFFSLVVSVYQLSEDKRLLKSLGTSLGLSLAVTTGLTLFGILTVLIANPERIQIPAEIPPTEAGFTFRNFFSQLFPASPAELFLHGDFLLPFLLFAVMLGMVCHSERANAKPTVILFDSLSHISYHLNNFFVEFIGLGIVIVSMDSVLAIRRIPDPSMFQGLFLILVIDCLLAVFVILPLLVYFACERKNPYPWIYALLAPTLTALTSGDVNFSQGILLKHAKESLGVRRRANSVSVSIATILGRAGSSMVAAVSFIVIIKSYSSLGISGLQILWVLVTTVFVSLFLGAVPGAGSFVAVTLLCQLFGRGFGSAYLIVKPIVVPLVALGAFVDIFSAGIVTLISGKISKMQEDKEARFFI